MKLGLRISELKLVSYVDILKMIVSSLPEKENENNIKEATQEDIDKILG